MASIAPSTPAKVAGTGATATPKSNTKLRAVAPEFVFTPSVTSPLVTSTPSPAVIIPPIAAAPAVAVVAPVVAAVVPVTVAVPSTPIAVPAVAAPVSNGVAATNGVAAAKKKKSALRASAVEFVMPGFDAPAAAAAAPVVATPPPTQASAAVVAVAPAKTVPAPAVVAVTPVVATPTPVVTPPVAVAPVVVAAAPAKVAVAAAPKKAASAWGAGANKIIASVAPVAAKVASVTKVVEEPKVAVVAAKKEEKVEPVVVAPVVVAAVEEDEGWEQASSKKKNKGKKGQAAVVAPKKPAGKQAAVATPAVTPAVVATPVVAAVTPVATPVVATPAIVTPVVVAPVVATPVVAPVVAPVAVAPAKTEAPKLSAKAKKAAAAEEKKKLDAAAAAAAATVAAPVAAKTPVQAAVTPIVAPIPVVAAAIAPVAAVTPITTSSPSPPPAITIVSPSLPPPVRLSALAARKQDAANKMAAAAAAAPATTTTTGVPSAINTSTPLPSPTAASSAAAAANGSSSVAPSPLPSPLGPLSPSPVSELKVEAVNLPTGPPAPVARDPEAKYSYDRAAMEAIAAAMMETPLPWALINMSSGLGEFFPRNDRTPSGGTPGTTNWRPNNTGALDRRPARDNNNSRYRDAPNSGRGGPLRTPRGGPRDARDPRSRHQVSDNTPFDPLAAPSENRYQITRNVEGDAKILREFKAILNKLTPEKFEPLIEKTLSLDINRVEMLRDIVQHVFEKALTEPAFCPTYADFCKALGDKMLVSDPTAAATGDDTKKESFRRLILNRCQVEFSTFFGDVAAADALPETASNGDIATDSDAPATPPVVETEDQKKLKIKRRMLGTIRFIGELYSRGMIAEKIMKDCVRMLAKDDGAVDEESIEALCNLLITVGKKLELKGKDALDPVFVILTALSENRVIPSRLRFMVKDSLDLRRNGWVQRIQKAEAKKISDLHKDHEEKQRAADEAAKRATAAAERGGATRGGTAQGFRRGGGADRYGAPKNNLPSPSPRKPKSEATADGWQSQTSRGLKAPLTRGVAVTAVSSRGGKMIGRGGAAASRGASAVAKKGVSAGDKGQVSAEVVNAYDALEDEEDDNNDARSPTTRAAAAAVASTEEEEPKAEVELEEEGDVDEKTLGEAKEQIHQITREFIEAWVPGVSEGVFKEARERSKLITNIRSVSQLFIGETLKLACEGKAPLRAAAPVFLMDLCDEKILSDTQIVKGLTAFMSIALDLAEDCPKLYEFVATMLTPLIVAERLPVSFFTSDAVEPLDDSRGRLLVDVLASLAKAKSIEDAVTAFKSLNLTVDDLKDYFMARDASPEAIKKYFTSKTLGDIAALL